MRTDLKPTTQQQERAKHADPLWLLHSDLNKLIAACAFEIIGGMNPATQKRQLYANIQAVSAKYLTGEEGQCRKSSTLNETSEKRP
jgi:hypothetical protein